MERSAAARDAGVSPWRRTAPHARTIPSRAAARSRRRLQQARGAPPLAEGSGSKSTAAVVESQAAELLQRLSSGAEAGPSSQPGSQADPAPSKFELLVDGGSERRPSLAEIEAAFDFPLDGFQRQAVTEFLAGHSVVVCAPTGAGKTAIAQAATADVLARGGRVIYTTPLKALSNQKLQEMRAAFGARRVGLQTGDASLNAEGDVVVMTTEVLRNILFRPGSLPGPEDGSGNGGGGNGSGEGRMRGVGLVVLDEVHYLADPDRGSVWEEVIIGCPAAVPLLCMSATVRNPEDLGGWIGKVHGSCRTVVTDFRPVPLSWSFCHADEVAARLTPLLGPDGRLHPALRADGGAGLEERRGFGSLPPPPPAAYGQNGRRRPRYEASACLKAPATEEALAAIAAAKWLPAIWFVFSRKGCDSCVQRLHAQRLVLTTPAQRARVEAAIATLKAEQPEAIREGMLGPLLDGIASHHAGCLPAWKALIEELFRLGLVQVVFATGTLAAGINMPARSTVISSTSRREGAGHKLLSHNELLQMAGRAGRRGFDTEGHSILLQDRFGEPGEAVDVLARGPEPLRSHFSTRYGMVLKLLHSRSLADARAFVQRSFFNYLADEGVKAREKAIAAAEEEAAQLLFRAVAAEAAAGGAQASFRSYLQLKKAYQDARRGARKAVRAATRSRGANAVRRLGTLPALVGLELDTLHNADDTEVLPAAIVSLQAAEDSSDEEGATAEEFEPAAKYLCLAADNRLFSIKAKHIAAIAPVPPALSEAEVALVCATAEAAPRWELETSGSTSAAGSARTAGLAARIAAAAAAGLEPVLPAPRAAEAAADAVTRLAEAKAEAEQAQRAASRAKPEREDLQLRAEATRLKRRARDLRASLQASSQRKEAAWRSFEASLRVLVSAGALQPGSYAATQLGEVARELNGENELWLAIVLTHPAVQGLRPPELAAALSSMVMTEVVVRPGISVQYGCSEAVLTAVESMEREREQLFQLQAAAGVEAGLAVDVRLAGVVEAWAAGATWAQIMADCSLDGGDVARMLSRTLDCLRQATHCEALHPDVRRSARRAMHAMARAPITELVQ